jgi:hypothetical protein
MWMVSTRFCVEKEQEQQLDNNWTTKQEQQLTKAK